MASSRIFKSLRQQLGTFPHEISKEPRTIRTGLVGAIQRPDETSPVSVQHIVRSFEPLYGVYRPLNQAPHETDGEQFEESDPERLPYRAAIGVFQVSIIGRRIADFGT